jgi:hypothetical protein
MAKIPTGFVVTFDANGNPDTLRLEQTNIDPTGQASAQVCEYTLAAADITSINAVVANAQVACGI